MSSALEALFQLSWNSLLVDFWHIFNDGFHRVFHRICSATNLQKRYLPCLVPWFSIFDVEEIQELLFLYYIFSVHRMNCKHFMSASYCRHINIFTINPHILTSMYIDIYSCSWCLSLLSFSLSLTHVYIYIYIL